MITSIDIDEKLMNEARRVTGLRTKKAVVETALQALIRLQGQVEVRQLWGRLHWEDPSAPPTPPVSPTPEAARGKRRAGPR